MTEERWLLPNSWAWAEAQEIAKIVGGGTPPSKDFANFSKNGIPWLTPADLSDYRSVYIERGARDLSEKGYSVSGAQKMPAGTVLFSSRAPIGYCVIASNEISTNQGFKSFVLESGLIPEYLRYYLISAKEYAESLASGTTFLELSGARTKLLAIPIAPTAEQHRIVSKLDALFARTRRAREELVRMVRLAVNYRRSILAAAYTGELLGETSALTNGARSRSLSIPELVDEKVRNGLSVKGADSLPGVRALRLSALRGGSVDLTDVRYLPITEERAQRFLLRTGDVLVSRGNGTKALVGLAALVSHIEHPTIFPDTAFRVRLNPQLALPKWFALVWNAPQVRFQIESVAKTTAGIWKISQSDLARIGLRVPGIAEQREIIGQVETAFSWLDKVETEYERVSYLLEQLDDKILAKAFRGELVPQEPNDEPAGVLLEKIRADRARRAEIGNAPRRREKIKQAAKITKRRKGGMGKKRTNVERDHLRRTLDALGGMAGARELWQRSEMEIEEFYKQLRDEVKAGYIREGASKDELVLADAA